jgi:hypothetical protein
MSVLALVDDAGAVAVVAGSADAFGFGGGAFLLAFLDAVALLPDSGASGARRALGVAVGVFRAGGLRGVDCLERFWTFPLNRRINGRDGTGRVRAT